MEENSTVAINVNPVVGASESADSLRRFPESRLSVPEFLDSTSAQQLFDELASSSLWNLVACDGRKYLAVTADARRAGRRDLESKLGAIAYSSAKNGFAYLREEISAPASPAAIPTDFGPALTACFAFFRSQEFCALCSRITGKSCTGVNAVAALRYARGHFRCFRSGTPNTIAFSLNLTPKWRSIWGGSTQLLGFNGDVSDTFIPAFNRLDLFDSEALWNVSFVGPMARTAAYSIRGELCAEAADLGQSGRAM